MCWLKWEKFSPKDELNCGACGYNTCREKAIAIIQNKAEVAMCIPYMRARQESYSNKVFNAMPGLLVTVDYNLKIIQMNQAATKLFKCTEKKAADRQTGIRDHGRLQSCQHSGF